MVEKWLADSLFGSHKGTESEREIYNSARLRDAILLQEFTSVPLWLREINFPGENARLASMGELLSRVTELFEATTPTWKSKIP